MISPLMLGSRQPRTDQLFRREVSHVEISKATRDVLQHSVLKSNPSHIGEKENRIVWISMISGCLRNIGLISSNHFFSAPDGSPVPPERKVVSRVHVCS